MRRLCPSSLSELLDELIASSILSSRVAISMKNFFVLTGPGVFVESVSTFKEEVPSFACQVSAIFSGFSSVLLRVELAFLARATPSLPSWRRIAELSNTK